MDVRTNIAKPLLLSLLFTAASCTTPTTNQMPEELHTRVDELEERVDAIETSNKLRSLLESVNDVAYLTPGASGYSLIETNHGLLAVSFEDIAPYANGSRVTLRIGNTTNADYNGATTQVEWGPLDDSGFPDNEKITTKEVLFTDTFDGGSWADIQIVLNATPPSDVGFVRVRQFNVSSISLASP